MDKAGAVLSVVIDVERLVVCGESHGYDGTVFVDCPNCGSAERVPLVSWIGSMRKAPEKEEAPR